jgi:hypothetical protein
MWPLADSSMEVSHNAYQEAEGVVMEAILRKGTIISSPLVPIKLYLVF